MPLLTPNFVGKFEEDTGEESIRRSSPKTTSSPARAANPASATSCKACSSPKAPTSRGWVWGVGPALLLPSATDDLLGTGKWGAGPTAVALKQTSAGWTYGALFNRIRSFAGSDNRADVDSTFLQPFVSKSLGMGRTATVNFESTYDHEQKQWTVPLNVTYSKVGRIGDQLVSYAGGVRYYFEAPDGGPEWGVRFVFTLLFPSG